VRRKDSGSIMSMKVKGFSVRKEEVKYLTGTSTQVQAALHVLQRTTPYIDELRKT
jgi:hypothetical protein